MADLHAILRKRLDSARVNYVSDLESMTAEQLGTSPGGAARTPFDFTYEVAFVNRRVAMRLRGEVPEPFPSGGWITAPEGLRTVDQAVAEINSSVDEVLAAWDALAEDDLEKGFVGVSGETMSFIDLMFMVSYHMGYHDAQLNYLQAILGDAEVHWK